MPIIKIKNPNYVDGGGEEKWIDAAIYTNQSNEGVEEAPNNGKDYVRRDSDWVISQKIYDELGITKARFESLLNNAYIIPTLGAVPDETTLVYVDGEYNVNFKIGDYCRVRNTDSEYGYDFFRLYDIKDGVAVWSAAETEGSGSASGETVLISLISNQSASDNALLGASIQVYDVNDDKNLVETTWQGTEVMVSVPKGHMYTVSVGEVIGYRTPAVKSLEAVNGATRMLNMQYDTTILTVNFTQNHTANVSNCTATITYGSTSTTIKKGQSVKVPYDSSVSIVCSKLQYYKTPTVDTFIAGSTTKEFNLEYITSFLVVNYTKNQSIGGAPTIQIVTEGVTRTYSANMICAPGEQVTIKFGGITYYKTPANITFTKGVGTETKQGDYLSEKVTVSLSTNDSKAVTGQVITVANGARPYGTFQPGISGYYSHSSSIYQTYTCTSTATSGDSGLSFYIPYGQVYHVHVPPCYSYALLETQQFTAGTTNRNITFQYIYTEYILTVTCDSSYSPSGTIDGKAIEYVYYGDATNTFPAGSRFTLTSNTRCGYCLAYNKTFSRWSLEMYEDTQLPDVDVNLWGNAGLAYNSYNSYTDGGSTPATFLGSVTANGVDVSKFKCGNNHTIGVIPRNTKLFTKDELNWLYTNTSYMKGSNDTEIYNLVNALDNYTETHTVGFAYYLLKTLKGHFMELTSYGSELQSYFLSSQKFGQSHGGGAYIYRWVYDGYTRVQLTHGQIQQNWSINNTFVWILNGDRSSYAANAKANNASDPSGVETNSLFFVRLY